MAGTNATRGRTVTARGGSAAITAVVLGGVALSAAGCSASDPDVTHDGQVAYACALAAHVADGDPDIASWTMIGDDADPLARATVAMGSLAGGSLGFVLDEHAELSDAGKSVVEGVALVDPEAMQTGLDDFASACDGLSVSAEGDVSDEGQVRYGCDLAVHVVEEHGSAESWESPLGEEPAWHETMSVGALFGAPLGQTLPAHPDLSAAGVELYKGVSTLDTEALDGGLEAVVDECEQLSG